MDSQPQQASPRKTVATLMALSSALLFIALVAEDMGELTGLTFATIPWGLFLRYLLGMALAGALCGAALSSLFGRPGFFGWILVFAAGIVTATIAGVLGSFFGLLPELLSDGWQSQDMVAIGAGALVLPLAAIGWTPLLAVWIALVGAAHFRAMRARG